MITKVYKRDGAVVSFDQNKIVQAVYKAAAEVGRYDLNLARKISDRVAEIIEHHFPDAISTVEDIQDVVERVLIEKGYDKIAKAYIVYREKRREMRDRKESQEIETVPYKIIWRVLVWNLDHACETISKLNGHIKKGTFPKLVKEAEEVYEQEISDLISALERKLGKIRLLSICGPSSSGKTTTTERLARELNKRGKFSFVKLNIDNYFCSPKHYLYDDQGDYDCEGPYALDLPLINRHLANLMAGREIKVPRYNFKVGIREKETDNLRLKPGQILLIDSHFGIYDKLTESVPESEKYKIYLETFCQLKDKDNRFVRWTDIRLLRRMIRDAQFRSYNPTMTVGHWHYVRRGEIKNIIPYISRADYILNTSLPYELPILKYYLFKFLPKIIQKYKKEPSRQDAYLRAQRVYSLLKQVNIWRDVSVVPKQSILKEFIG